MMRNIQVIDGADNATFSIFQATEEEFGAIFPNGQDMELAEDFFARAGNEKAVAILTPVWDRPILKRDAQGIHGTLFYDWERKRNYIPATKREADVDPLSVNSAQRRHFDAHR